jgi:hypothetical protein
MLHNSGTILSISPNERPKINIAAQTALMERGYREFHERSGKYIPTFTPEEFEAEQAAIANDSLRLQAVLATSPTELLRQNEAAFNPVKVETRVR